MISPVRCQLSAHSQLLLTPLELLPAIFFALAAYRTHQLARIIGYEKLESWTLGFSLLSISQVLMAASIVTPPRESFVLYSTATAFAVSGFYTLIYYRAWRGDRSHQALVISGIPIILDILAGIGALMVASRARRVVRASLAVIGVTHVARAAGVLLSPSPEALILLVASEALRAVAAASLSVYYSKRLI